MRILPRHQANRTLTQSYSQLEALVMERTTALQNLSQRLLKVQDEERRKVARDLHDSTGQTLAAMKISVALLQRKLAKDHEACGELSGIARLADQALQEIRTTSYLLHPPLLDAAGFNCAARWYIAGFAKRSGTKVRMDFAEEIERLPDNVEVALFRVLQESLTNVHRHAGTSEVEVRFCREAQAAILEVRDYGCGLPKELLNCSDRNSGVGLAGMRERLNDLKGKLEIEPADPGTRLRAIVPLFVPMPSLAQPPPKEPSSELNEWRKSALAARVMTALVKRVPPRVPRRSMEVAAITVLAITGWITYSDHRSPTGLETSNAYVEHQAQPVDAKPKAAWSAFKRVRVGQNEVDYIAEDVTVRYFTDESASQGMRVRYKQVDFGEDVTVRYFAPKPSIGPPMRPVANLALN